MTTKIYGANIYGPNNSACQRRAPLRVRATHASNNERARVRECIETTLERMLVTAVVFLKSHGVVFLEAWLGRVFKKLGTYIPGTAKTIKRKKKKKKKTSGA